MAKSGAQKSREWRLKYPDKSKAAAKKWYYENHEHAKANARKRRAANPNLQRAANLLTKYGLSIKEYDGLLKSQGAACAICATTSDKLTKRLFVDHDHLTGAVRGLLCPTCNLYLGWLERHGAEATNYLIKRGLRIA